MDLYNLFDSKDMGKYLRKIGYSFSTAEAAFLVYVNGKMTIKEKHAAWQEIIDTMPNCSLAERVNMCAIPDFHEFLRKYMKLQNRLLDEFSEGENYVWRYADYCEGDKDWDRNYNSVFPDMQSCMEAIDAEMVDRQKYNYHIAEMEIYKQSLVARDKWNRSVTFTLALNVNKEPIRVGSWVLSDEDDEIYSAFDGMWFDFPTPFKRGDIVVSSYSPFGQRYGDKEIFVLSSLSTWGSAEAIQNGISKKNCEHWDKLRASIKARGDITDMTAYGYFLNDDGHPYYECMHAYYSLEFYRGKLSDEKRTLKAISMFIKDEIDADALLNAYVAILQQKSASDRIKRLDLYDKTLKKLGLK